MCMFCLFFFFKQKTAYEVRISDWSSDVCSSDLDGKVVVAGVNIITRHKKPNQQDPQGGLERKEAPLAVSKVAVADPKSGKATRVRFETRDGKKVRVAVKSGETING